MRRVVWGSVVCLVFVGVAYGVFGWLRNRPPEPPPIVVDRDGQPLPPFARGRIGRRPAVRPRTPIALLPDGVTAIVRDGRDGVATIDLRTGDVSDRLSVNDPGPGYVQVESRSIFENLGGRSSPDGKQALAMAISPDGALVAVSYDRAIRLWDRAAGSELHVWTDVHHAHSLAFSADGSRLAASGTAAAGRTPGLGLLKVYGTDDGATLASMSGSWAGAVAISPDGQTLATKSDHFRLASVERNAVFFSEKAREHGGPGIVFSSDGSFVMHYERADGPGRDVRMVSRDGATGAVRWRTESFPREGPLAVSPDGRFVIGGGDTVELIDAASGARLRTFDEGTGWGVGAAFSGDGRRLAIARRRQVSLRDVETGAYPYGSPAAEPLERAILRVAFSADGQTIATAEVDGAVAVWDPRDGALRAALRPSAAFRPAALCVSATGSRVALLQGYGRATLWDVATGKILTEHDDGPHSGAIGIRAERLLRARMGPDGVVEVLDVESGDATGLGVAVGLGSAMFSADGELLAMVAGKPGLGVWEVASGARRTPFAGSEANHLDFSPDGTWLVTWRGGPLRAIDTRTGEVDFEINAWTGSSDIPIAISPEGRFIAWAGRSTVVELWSRAGERLHRFEGHGDWITDLAFSPDGETLASTDGWTVLLWDLTPFR